MTSPQLVDGLGRRHDYLRVSVTDRCNLRCTYCMPPEGVPRKPRDHMLRYSEIVRVARVLSGFGVDKVRITGGEPLVRRDLPRLVADLHALPGIRTVAMTTNGVLLEDFAQELKSAGLDSINLGLDTLRPDRFREITLRDGLPKVLKGLDAALAAGFAPLKLNVVVMRGVNEDEIIPFAEWTRDHPIHVRFIEFMPFRDNQWSKERLVPYAEIRAALESRWPLIPVLPPDPSQPAQDFAVPGHRGRLGIIASMTRPFCARCSRLRLTAEGGLKTCLFHFPGRQLREALRDGMSDEELADAIRAALRKKPAGHAGVDALAGRKNRAMTEIGG